MVFLFIGFFIVRRHTLIQESEEPKGNTVAETDLNVVDCEVTVRNIGNLFKSLSFASDFEKMFPVDKEIPLFWVSDIVQDA